MYMFPLAVKLASHGSIPRGVFRDMESPIPMCHGCKIGGPPGGLARFAAFAREGVGVCPPLSLALIDVLLYKFVI